MREKSKVVLRSVTNRPLVDIIHQCLTSCGWDNWLKPGDTVVIKPNCCTAVPDKVLACNTDVAVMRALCEVLLTRTKRIFVGESGHMRQKPWQAFAASGYNEMARDLGITLVNFSEGPVTTVEISPAGKIGMPRQLLEADAYINVPVLKTHALTYFTGALKNQWGCLPDYRDRLRYHRSLDALLPAIQKLLAPKLVIMDAIVGMEGRGPVNGQVRRLDALLASEDAVAIDATAMRLVGLATSKCRHLSIAGAQQLGNLAEERIEIDGNWDQVVTKFAPPPRDIANTAMFFATQYPWFVKYILGNDKVYYPIRDAVVFLRNSGLVAK